MEKKSPLPPRPHESGAALIVMVLLALLVLAGLVIVSSNLALGSRRTTTEQKAILPAQLAAESGVAYAKAKLTAANQLFKNMGVPVGTTKTDFYSMLGGLCPSSVSLPLKGTYGSNQVPGTSITLPTSQVVCQINTLTGSQTRLLATLMSGSGGQVYRGGTTQMTDTSAAAYASLGLPSDDTNRNKFFSDVFSTTNPVDFGDTKVISGLQPIALMQTNDTNMGDKAYKLYFRVAGVDSTGSVNGSKRRIAVGANSKIHVLNINFTVNTVGDPPPTPVPGVPASFSGYGLFVNNFQTGIDGSGGEYGYNNHFSGPFHSNTIMKLGVTDGESIDIDGALSSSGCQSIGQDKDGNDTCVNKSDAVWMNIHDGATCYNRYGQPYSCDIPIKKTTKDFSFGTTSNGFKPFGYNDSYGRSDILIKDRGSKTVAPNFNSDFVPLPLKATKQRSMASSGGILLNNPRVLQLSVDSTGIQRIDITSSTGVKSTLGFDKDNVMKILVSGKWVLAAPDSNSVGGWKAASSSTPSTFNGMIYADGDIQSFSGPARTYNSSNPPTAPALASFAQITVTAQNNIFVTGDLKYTNECLTINDCTTKDASGNYTTKNMLGIYASQGDIKLPFDASVSKATYQNIDPSKGDVSAPKNLQLDAFVMSARGTIQPYDSDSDTNTTDGALDRGTFKVYGGAVKNKEALVRSGNMGWSESYYFDSRGNDSSPPGFPTTSEAIPGSGGGSGTLSEGNLINSWTGGVSLIDSNGNEILPSGTETVNSDFRLDKEVLQQKAN